MTLLSDFLAENGITPDMVVNQSHHLERTPANDHGLLAKRAMARANKKPYAELALDKPKTLGRGVSKTAVDRAMVGTAMPRLVRKKITRAVNAILVVQKKEPADWRKLFGDVKSKKKPKKK
ncbi:hypothetical protein L6R52_09695 [Myxococcota bacterium]|nr:hypothetical protein [Myxococcota bacterium]